MDLSAWQAAWDAGRQWVQGRLGGLAGAVAALGGPSGVPWPPPADVARLRRYERGRQLYRAQHQAVYVQGHEPWYDPTQPYIVVNMLGELTDLVVDRLFGEDVQISAADPAADEWLAHLREVSGLDRLLIELAQGTSYRGDGVFKIRYDAALAAVVIDTISPSVYFPTRDDAGRLESVLQAWIVIGQDGKPYLRQEIHTPGHIENELYELHPDGRGGWRYEPAKDKRELATLTETAELPEQQDTGIGEIPFIHIASRRSDDDEGPWGTSDYDDVDSLQEELNRRRTQCGRILNTHADPWMAGDQSVLDESGQLNTSNKFLIMRGGEQPPQYLAWDPQMSAAENEIEGLKAELIFCAGLSPESFGLGEGGAESGRALKLRQHRTASAVRSRQRTYGVAIRRAIAIASQMAYAVEAGVPLLEPADVTLGWQDGLPNDETEQLERIVVSVEAGLLSRRDAIVRLQGVSEDEADAMLAGIRDEQRQDLPAAPTLGLASTIKAVGPALETAPTQGADE